MPTVEISEKAAALLADLLDMADDSGDTDAYISMDEVITLRAALRVAASMSPTDETRMRALLTQWVERTGLGFHPDTKGADYVVVGKAGMKGARFFTDEEAARYDADIEAACGLGDVYAVSLKIWEEKGLL